MIIYHTLADLNPIIVFCGYPESPSWGPAGASIAAENKVRESLVGAGFIPARNRTGKRLPGGDKPLPYMYSGKIPAVAIGVYLSFMENRFVFLFFLARAERPPLSKALFPGSTYHSNASRGAHSQVMTRISPRCLGPTRRESIASTASLAIISLC